MRRAMVDRPKDEPRDAPERDAENDALRREVEYYRREYNDIGARLLRHLTRTVEVALVHHPAKYEHGLVVLCPRRSPSF